MVILHGACLDSSLEMLLADRWGHGSVCIMTLVTCQCPVGHYVITPRTRQPAQALVLLPFATSILQHLGMLVCIEAVSI